MTIQLRDYQREAVSSIAKYWDDGNEGNPIIIAPTSAGKSLIIADFCKQAITSYPGTRILVVTHVKELIEQNEAELKEYWFEAPTGIYSASVKRREMDMPITFAGIQSIYGKAFEFKPFDLIIVDECHLIPHKNGGMYRSFFRDCLIANPHTKVIGLTASPFRLDGGSLIHGENRMFEGVAYNISVKKLLDDGYLTPLTAQEGIAHIETKLLDTVGGEYSKEAQQKAFHTNGLTERAIDEIIKLGQDRKSWMIFCSNVEHAKEVSDILNDKGISAVCVDGGMKTKDRERSIAKFKRLEYRCIVSVNVLTTGFNVKQVDLIALLRSTKSPALYYQILGRGMRLYPGKENCLVLDYGENILNHGPVDEIVERQLAKGEKKKRKGEAVMKRCAQCELMVHASVRICPSCNYKFPFDTLPKIEQSASRLAVLSSERKAQEDTFKVNTIRYTRHQKPGKPASLKVTYTSGLAVFSEWICIEHEGYAKTKARNWWISRSKEIPPSTVDEAMSIISQHGISEPHSIRVIHNSKYPQITDYSF